MLKAVGIKPDRLQMFELTRFTPAAIRETLAEAAGEAGRQRQGRVNKPPGWESEQ